MQNVGSLSWLYYMLKICNYSYVCTLEIVYIKRIEMNPTLAHSFILRMTICFDRKCHFEVNFLFGCITRSRCCTSTYGHLSCLVRWAVGFSALTLESEILLISSQVIGFSLYFSGFINPKREVAVIWAQKLTSFWLDLALKFYTASTLRMICIIYLLLYNCMICIPNWHVISSVAFLDNALSRFLASLSFNDR